jgi:hypothetical protein
MERGPHCHRTTPMKLALNRGGQARCWWRARAGWPAVDHSSVSALMPASLGSIFPLGGSTVQLIYEKLIQAIEESRACDKAFCYHGPFERQPTIVAI